MSNKPESREALSERIAAFHVELATKVPPEVGGVIADEIATLVRAGTGDRAPRAGDAAPVFTLPDARGGEVSLERLLQTGPVVLVFYRGQWCPYCDLALRAYQEVLPRIRALGATLVAISPQTPDGSLSTAETKALAFPVLSDRGLAVARRYGLVFRVSPGLAGVHAGFGIDLAKSNDAAPDELPVPGVFVVGRDGRIAFSFVDADYRRRLEPAELVRRLEQLR